MTSGRDATRTIYCEPAFSLSAVIGDQCDSSDRSKTEKRRKDLILKLYIKGCRQWWGGGGGGGLGGLKPPFFQALNIEKKLFKLSKTHLLQQSSSCNS